MMLTGCKNLTNTVSPETGDWTVKVDVALYDEFNMPVPASGAIDLTLTAKDRTLHTVLENGQTTHSFGELPYQQYLVTVRKDGYFLCQQSSPMVDSYGLVTYRAQMYALPGPMTRIDSIQYELNTTVPRVYLKLFTPQALPYGGWRGAVIFAGLTPGVSARYGTYIATIGLSQSAGTSYFLPSYFQTANVYDTLRAAGIAPGVIVYLTARVLTNGAISSRDEATGLTLYSNLETNSTTITSFTMP
jgi:hypothetical protein